MSEPAFNPEQPPELNVARWFNTQKPLHLSELRGQVVLLMAFQMLCPGCTEHGLPQVRRLRERFNESEVAIIGLHSVFEHHAVMTPAATEVFLQEYRWPFPVAFDEPDGKGMPKTMAAYQMQGTPTLLIFDRKGRLRRHYFGKPDDLLLAAEIMALVIEGADATREQSVAIERILGRALKQPSHEHSHQHDDAHGHEHGEDCDCGHHHDHGPEHAHHHGPGHAKTHGRHD